MKLLVFNGWAAGPETWYLTTFPHDWVFNYIEQLDGLPEKVMEDSDAVILVGFSMGGSSAMRMVLRFPEKVKGLVLISATPYMMEEKKVEKEGVGGGGEWKGMSERRLAALRLGTELVFKDDPSPIYDPQQMERGLRYLRETDLREELSRRVATVRTAPVSEAASSWNFPVRIIQSEKDGIVRPHNAAWLKGVFPQAKVVMVPGNEHILPIAAPEIIDETVYELLEGL